MFVLVIYDISTKDRAGRRRLYKVAKICSEYGVPVQKSVYEIETNAGNFRVFDGKIREILKEEDNVRYYMLGNHYQNKIVNLGSAREQWDRENYIV